MTERQLLRLVHSIVLAQRRAKGLRCAKLTNALDHAAYYAGRELGAMITAPVGDVQGSPVQDQPNLRLARPTRTRN